MELNPSKSWIFPKAHTHKHMFNDIQRKGVTQNYNTKPNEKCHSAFKNSYKFQTNFKNVAPQIFALDIVDTVRLWQLSSDSQIWSCWSSCNCDMRWHWLSWSITTVTLQKFCTTHKILYLPQVLGTRYHINVIIYKYSTYIFDINMRSGSHALLHVEKSEKNDMLTAPQILHVVVWKNVKN